MENKLTFDITNEGFCVLYGVLRIKLEEGKIYNGNSETKELILGELQSLLMQMESVNPILYKSQAEHFNKVFQV